MAAAKNAPLPKIEEIKDELSMLDTYRNQVGKRAKVVEKARKKLEQPPKAITA